MADTHAELVVVIILGAIGALLFLGWMGWMIHPDWSDGGGRDIFRAPPH